MKGFFQGLACATSDDVWYELESGIITSTLFISSPGRFQPETPDLIYSELSLTFIAWCTSVVGTQEIEETDDQDGH